MNTENEPGLVATAPRSDSALSSDDADERLEQALAEFRTAWDAGERLQRRRLLAKYPDIAPQLRECLDTMDLMAELAPQVNVQDAPEGGDARTDEPPRELGDFRILREIGRGGMGVVYEAEQISLSRRVALKILPLAGMLDTQQLSRFRNEARAAAALDHPNIVAVHSVGTERGVHYYAMQLVEGQSLAQVIGELRIAERGLRNEGAESDSNDPDSQSEIGNPPAEIDTTPIAALSTVPNADIQKYFRSAARLGIQAAQALDHAHQHGIVHRDVKPGNLLVSSESQLWVTDFGLARIESDASLTMTGDLVGTLRYMSPEQAQAARAVVDHRTDIYSLGATLYELLTLQPVFDSDNRQELLRKIAQDEPVSPGKINPSISRDLVTIVGKAMEKQAEDRYPSAQAMADDLTCFLQDRPIHAQRPTVAARVVKWTRRHTAAVWTSVAVSVLISLVLAISTALIFTAYRSEAEQRRRAEKQQQQAEEQRQRAEDAYEMANERFNLARRAVDDLYEGIATPWLNSGHVLSDVQREFLERAKSFYQEIAQQETLDTLSLGERGEVYLRLFSLHHALAQWQEALAATESAAKTFEALIRDEPDSPDQQRRLAWAHNNAGVVLRRLGRYDEADEVLRMAFAVFERLAIASPDDADAQAGVASGYVNRSGCVAEFESQAEGEQLARKGLDLASQVAERSELLKYDELVLIATGQLSGLLADQGRHEEAESLLRDAVDRCDFLVITHPSMRLMAGRLRSARAMNLAKLARLDEAEAAYREGLECVEKALRSGQSPVDTIGTYLLDHSQLSRNMEPDSFWEHADMQRELGRLLVDRGQREEAIRLVSESTRVLGVLIVMSPGTPGYMDSTAASKEILAALLKEEKPDCTLRHLREAVEIRREIAEIAPRHIDYRAALGESLGQLGVLLAARGESADAQSLLEEAIREDETVLEIRPDHPEVRDHLAQHLSHLARLLATVDPTERDSARAVTLARRGVELAPEEENAWTTLAIAQYRSGDWAEAVSAAEKAVARSEGGTDHLILAMAHWRLGHSDEAHRWYVRAVEWMETNESEDEDLRRFRAEAAELIEDGGRMKDEKE